MNIEIKGHSGCAVDIIDTDNMLLVRKSTTDPGYVNRLMQQMRKQEAASKNIGDVRGIQVPCVCDHVEAKDHAEFYMRYVFGKNYIDFFESASLSDIKYFCTSLVLFIENELSRSTMQRVPVNVFTDKIKSVIDNCKKNDLVKDCDEAFSILYDVLTRFDGINEVELPVGVCHGDLTFSNILFGSNEFFVIDFLDSFIETPLQDIVKIRQDSKYMWSTQMYNKNYDVLRVKMISKYIDECIDNAFINNDWYACFYTNMQIINIARILPYVKEERVKVYVIDILKDLLYESK